MSGHPRYKGTVIDSHTHFDAKTGGMAARVLARAGLGACVNLWGIEWPPLPFERWKALWRPYSDRMAVCFVPDLSCIGSPHFEQNLAEHVREAATRGAVGIKVWKNLGLWLRDAKGNRVHVDDHRLDVLWEAAAEADLPVAIHVGDPPEFFDPVTPNNDRYHELLMHPEWWFGSGEYPSLGEIHEQFESVVSRHPSTTFIGLHFGCFMSFADVARMLNTYDNYCVDTAARIEDLGRGDVGRVRSVFERFPERIIFGTDLARTEIFEMPDLGEKREDVREFYERHWSFFETGKDGLPLPLPFGRSWTLTGLELDQQTLERLYFKNAFRVFRLLDRALGTQT